VDVQALFSEATNSGVVTARMLESIEVLAICGESLVSTIDTCSPTDGGRFSFPSGNCKVPAAPHYKGTIVFKFIGGGTNPPPSVLAISVEARRSDVGVRGQYVITNLDYSTSTVPAVAIANAPPAIVTAWNTAYAEFSALSPPVVMQSGLKFWDSSTILINVREGTPAAIVAKTYGSFKRGNMDVDYLEDIYSARPLSQLDVTPAKSGGPSNGDWVVAPYANNGANDELFEPRIRDKQANAGDKKFTRKWTNMCVQCQILYGRMSFTCSTFGRRQKVVTMIPDVDALIAKVLMNPVSIKDFRAGRPTTISDLINFNKNIQFYVCNEQLRQEVPAGKTAPVALTLASGLDYSGYLFVRSDSWLDDEQDARIESQTRAFRYKFKGLTQDKVSTFKAASLWGQQKALSRAYTLAGDFFGSLLATEPAAPAATDLVVTRIMRDTRRPVRSAVMDLYTTFLQQLDVERTLRLACLPTNVLSDTLKTKWTTGFAIEASENPVDPATKAPKYASTGVCASLETESEKRTLMMNQFRRTVFSQAQVDNAAQLETGDGGADILDKIKVLVRVAYDTYQSGHATGKLKTVARRPLVALGPLRRTNDGLTIAMCNEVLTATFYYATVCSKADNMYSHCFDVKVPAANFLVNFVTLSGFSYDASNLSYETPMSPAATFTPRQPVADADLYAFWDQSFDEIILNDIPDEGGVACSAQAGAL